MAGIKSFYWGLVHVGDFLKHFLLLAIRLFWGYQFYTTGLGKLQNPEPVIEYFTSLGIPLATVNVYLTGCTELVCGALLLVGFASRLAAIPLMIVMMVAYLTAHHDALIAIGTNPEEFIKQQPFTYLFTALIIFCFGPGMFSVDGIFKPLFNRKKHEKHPENPPQA